MHNHGIPRIINSVHFNQRQLDAHGELVADVYRSLPTLGLGNSRPVGYFFKNIVIERPRSTEIVVI